MRTPRPVTDLGPRVRDAWRVTRIRLGPPLSAAAARTAGLLGRGAGSTVRLLQDRVSPRRPRRSADPGRPAPPAWEPPDVVLRTARKIRGGSLTLRRVGHYLTLCSVGPTVFVSQWVRYLIGGFEAGESAWRITRRWTIGWFTDPPPPPVSPVLRAWDTVTTVVFLLLLGYAATWVVSDWICRRSEGRRAGVLVPAAAVIGVTLAISFVLVALQLAPIGPI